MDRSIGPEEAHGLALDYYVADIRRRAVACWHEATVREEPPGAIYLASHEPVWYVPSKIAEYGSYRMLRSGTVIVISKETGRMITVMSANDEG